MAKEIYEEGLEKATGGEDFVFDQGQLIIYYKTPGNELETCFIMKVDTADENEASNIAHDYCNEHGYIYLRHTFEIIPRIIKP